MPKLKSGTEYIYQTEHVWIEHDREDGQVVVCWQKSRTFNDHYETVSVEDLEPAIKPRAAIGKGKAKPTDADLTQFFDNQALQAPECCENCGGKLNAFYPWQKRFVTAHIVPKNDNEFPSVATHPDNRMFLGSDLFSDCNCHGLWDGRDAEARKTMPCYEIALSRASGFYGDLTPHEQNKFDKYFGLVKVV